MESFFHIREGLTLTPEKEAQVDVQYLVVGDRGPDLQLLEAMKRRAQNKEYRKGLITQGVLPNLCRVSR